MFGKIRKLFRFKVVDRASIAIQFLTNKIIVLKSMKKDLEEEISEIKDTLRNLKFEIISVLNDE